MRTRNRQNGMSLVELMIAMVIGLVLTGATVAIYLENRQTSRAAEILARMQDNARLAMDLIGRDIKMAGYYGIVSQSTWITGTSSGSTPLAPFAGDCEPGWYTDLAMPVWAVNDTNPYANTCIPAGQYQDDTDVLIVRRASTQTANLATATAGTLLLRASPSSGQLFTDPAAPPGNFNGTVEDRQIFVRAYYARPFLFAPGDNIPTLSVENLQPFGGAPAVRAAAFAPGVEQFQVQLGIDANDDGTVDFYRDPDVTAAPSTIDVSTIAAVRVWLLMRAEELEVDVNEAGPYTLGSMQYAIPVGTENYRRALFTSTFKTRNSF